MSYIQRKFIVGLTLKLPRNENTKMIDSRCMSPPWAWQSKARGANNPQMSGMRLRFRISGPYTWLQFKHIKVSKNPSCLALTFIAVIRLVSSFSFFFSFFDKKTNKFYYSRSFFCCVASSVWSCLEFTVAPGAHGLGPETSSSTKPAPNRSLDGSLERY